MIKETIDNAYIIGAQTDSAEIIGNKGYKNLIIKLDADGNLEWTRVHGIEGGINFTYDIAEDGNGDFVIAACDVMHNVPNVFKIDKNNGDFLWKANINGQMSVQAIQKTADGYIISGTQNNEINSRSQIGVLKLDLDGNLLWNKLLAHDYPCFSIHAALRTTINGGYVLSAKTHEAFGDDFDIILYILDSECNIQRKRIFDNNNRNDQGRVVHSFDGGYIMTAQTVDDKSMPRDYDIWFLKLDENGRLNQ